MNRRDFFKRIFGSVVAIPIIPKESLWNRFFNWVNSFFRRTKPKVADFKRITIPLVRRIYPQLIADKIVSVQPLLGPTSLKYYLNYKYSSEKEINTENNICEGWKC